MKNLRVYMPLVNDEQHTLECDSGRQLIDRLVGSGFAATPRSLVFEAQTSDKRTVRLVIPYSDSEPAKVTIEE